MAESKRADKVLIALMGLTGPVVTETLWCLWRYYGWWPDRLVLVTTQGALHNDRLENGSLLEKKLLLLVEELLNEKQQGTQPSMPDLDWSNQLDVFDLRSEDDLVLLQTLLSRLVIEVRQSGANLHLSAAGGRKGGAAVAMQVMERWGRSDHLLSQVLVDPPELESAERGSIEFRQDFWWPTAESSALFHYYPWEAVEGPPKSVTAKEVKLDLVDLPFEPARVPHDYSDLGKYVEFCRKAEGHVFELECSRESIVVRLPDRAASEPAELFRIDNRATNVADIEPKLLHLKPRHFALLWWGLLLSHPGKGSADNAKGVSVMLGAYRGNSDHLQTLFALRKWAGVADEHARGTDVAPEVSELRKSLHGRFGPFCEVLTGLKGLSVLVASPRLKWDCSTIPGELLDVLPGPVKGRFQ
jgi:CRISPR-associated protein (TIGR02584 family)